MTKSTWNHGGKTRQQRGYGRDHDQMRKHLMDTVILCQHCTAEGRTTIGTHADHIIPLAKGGTHARDNYQLLCHTCHGRKSLADRGGTAKPKPITGPDGWPIEDER